MKKLYMLICALIVCMSANAQYYQKILMLGSPSAEQMQNATDVDDDELAAYQWFMGHKGATYASAAQVKSGDVALSDYNAVWVILDRQLGKNNPEEFVNTLKTANDPLFDVDVIAALTAYYKAGGNLLLTNHASVLLKEMGRYANYPNSLGAFGSGDGASNGDTWYARVSYMNLEPVNDKSGDNLYAGIDIETFEGYKRFPLHGGGWKEDHNCFFNLDVTGNNNGLTEKYTKLANEFGVEYLAVWPHIGDICSAAITRWNAFGDFSGKAIAIGFGGYEWNINEGKANDCQGNIEKLTENALKELGGKAPAVAMYDFSKMAMIGTLAAEDDDEVAAREWFTLNKGNFIDAADIDAATNLFNYSVIWVVLDREAGVNSAADLVSSLSGDPLLSDAVVNKIKDYYMNGGSLLLTNHAAVLLTKMGRYENYPFSLGEFGSGAAAYSSVIQRARVSYMNLDEINDKSNDPIYAGIDIKTDGYKYFNLIGAGNQEGHHCYFNLDVPHENGGNFPNNDTGKYAALDVAYHVEPLAVVPRIGDICSAAITRWNPTVAAQNIQSRSGEGFKGTAIAIGFGGYEWNQDGGENAHQDNIEKLTANALQNLATKVNTGVFGIKAEAAATSVSFYAGALKLAGIEEASSVRIFNTAGALVYTTAVDSDSVLPLSLGRGLYVVAVSSAKGNTTSKIIVK